jgi:hypothetical protein
MPTVTSSDDFVDVFEDDMVPATVEKTSIQTRM